MERIRGVVIASLAAPLIVAGFGVSSATQAQAVSGAAASQSGPDPVSRVVLLGAAFAKGDAPPPTRGETAMAFLPGRGVVTWDVAGKSADEAREAQVEAMGLADARAVQREIDAAAAQKAAELARDQAQQRLAFDAAAGSRRVALNLPAVTGAGPAQEAAGVLPLNRAARTTGLALRNGETLKGKPRVYAFAAASGRGIGLNMTHDDGGGLGGWRNGGVTTDRDGYSGQRQAGLAWRKGAVQTSLSYVQEKDHAQILGMQSDKDHRVMLTMNVQPKAILDLFGKKKD